MNSVGVELTPSVSASFTEALSRASGCDFRQDCRMFPSRLCFRPASKAALSSRAKDAFTSRPGPLTSFWFAWT